MGGPEGEIDESNVTSIIRDILLRRRDKCYKGYRPSQGVEHGLACPKTFDGWNCWNETAANGTAYSACPFFIHGFVPTKMAYKQCMGDGSWYKRPENNHTWSNYTTCVDMEDLQWHRLINMFYETGYLISICALVISLVLFCSFKVLECTRVHLHKHLFVSFIISNLLWMIWYRVVVDDPDILFRSPKWCVALHILVQYFMVANYFWMFCEGFYLHTLLVLTFVRSDKKLIKGFYIFGWLGPIVPIACYVVFRSSDTLDISMAQCWINESSWSLILSVPVCVCLILSLAFLINILRVLVKKLKDNQRNFTNVCRRNSSIGTVTDNHLSLRKAVRATLILIPLLGLHYFLIPFRPGNGTREEAIYEVVAAFTASLQGFCVSLLFCFCNSEVVIVCRRRICQNLCKPKSRSHPAENSCAPTSMSIMVTRRIDSLITEEEI